MIKLYDPRVTVLLITILALIGMYFSYSIGEYNGCRNAGGMMAGSLCVFEPGTKLSCKGEVIGEMFQVLKCEAIVNEFDSGGVWPWFA